MTSAAYLPQMDDRTSGDTPRTHCMTGLPLDVVTLTRIKLKLARQRLSSLRAQMEDICSGNY